MAMIKFRAPPLPVPSLQYDQREQTDLIRALRIYFNWLDSLTPQQADSYKANNFYGGSFSGTEIDAQTINANTINGGNFTGNYADLDAVGAWAGKFNGLMAQTAVMGTTMSNGFYGGAFYGDGRYLSVPYNQFESDQDQTGAVATATAITFNTDLFPNSISIVSNSKITFGEKGIYQLTYSLSFTNPTNDRQDIDVWFRYKGTDIAKSNSRFSIPARKSTGANAYLIAVTPYLVDVVADGDYVEIMWRVTDATVTLDAIGAVAANPGVTPAIPATPSVILTVQFISAQYPPVERVAPAPVFGFGEIGQVTVQTL